ncbi:MAG: DUF1697 domain-containing protein [Chloracidobacterium sp.]|nr:DUF1697 domain-containing protein [Chloracidobacterium sp.]
MRYIALLRGINVGGNTMIKMTELKAVFERLGFENVATYINSGNISFDAKKTAEEKLVAKIEKAILSEFKKTVPVMVRERDAINGILSNNPYDGQFESHKHMHVLFLKEEMSPEKTAQLLEAAPRVNALPSSAARFIAICRWVLLTAYSAKALSKKN